MTARTGRDLTYMERRRGRVLIIGPNPGDLVARVMSTADICPSPDPKNTLKDILGMNRSMEYMTCGFFIAGLDLRETQVSAQSAGVWVMPNGVREYSDAIVVAIDHEAVRVKMAKIGQTDGS
jgi:hypothetical protein